MTEAITDLREMAAETAGLLHGSNIVRGSAPRGLQALEALGPLCELIDDTPFAESLAGQAQLVDTAMRRVRVSTQAYITRPSGNPAMAAEFDSGVAEFADQVTSFAATAYELAVEDLAPSSYLRDMSRIREELEARRLASEVRDVRDAAVQVLEETRRAAGTTGSTAMATHFGKYAAREHRTANMLRFLCAVSLLAIGCLAAVLLLLRDNSDVSTGREIAQLAVTIPLGLLAAYLGRESGAHRKTGRWATEIEVQLLTLDAFAEPLSAESRDLLRTELGRRALLGGPVFETDPISPSGLDEASQLIQRVADVIRKP
jgi:hypothetical protein